MHTIMEKINEFLFDIIGLLIPGIVFIILFSIFPMNKYNLRHLLSIISDSLSIDFKRFGIEYGYIIILILLFSYLLGHTIKVLAKKTYKFIGIFSDEFFIRTLKECYSKYTGNSVIKKSDNLIPKFISNNFLAGILIILFKHIFILIKKLSNYLVLISKDILIFEPPNYNKNNFKKMKNECIKLLNQKYDTNIFNNEEWHSFYKFSNSVIENNNIYSNASKFLAKYNFYRSISFIFLSHLIFTIFINWKFKIIYFDWIILFDSIMWFTFHTKYKRYWFLCGNEIIISVYYFLTRKEINRNDKEK